MSRRDDPVRAWENQLVSAYREYQYGKVLGPLLEQLRAWEAGDLEVAEADQAVHHAHRANQRLYSLFQAGRKSVIAEIAHDPTFLDQFAALHPPPPEVELRKDPEL
ncbi:MAG: hypothetical protein IT204_05590 [Fimbriimonadaceae bacterium]|nr:hypothetical protein [Fimbriimonadaceae bacterium]